MADLETLRPEVREAIGYFACSPYSAEDREKARVIRAELLRLTSENFYQHEANAGLYARMERMERAESELAALKARIADSPIASLVYGQGDLLAVISAENPDDWAGKRVRLVEVE